MAKNFSATKTGAFGAEKSQENLVFY